MSWRNPILLMKGGLARRTFALLLFAASLPIIVSTWLIVGHTHAYVDRRSHEALASEAKRYGLGLFQRLELAATALEAANADELVGAPNASAMPPATLTHYFAVVKLLPKDDGARDMFAFDSQSSTEGGTTLRIVRDENGTNAVALVHAQKEGWRFALLKHDYLWQPVSLPEELFVRVSDGDGKVLFASLPQTSQAQSPNAASESDAAFWELFLEQRLAGGKWRIDLIESHSELKSGFARYQRTVAFTLVPLVAALILFSSISIRRTHRPLEALTDATHRIAAGDFASRVTPSGDEDTRSLALAFNGMTEQIGRQFETLAVLSELDRHILSSSNLEDIVQTVLRHARAMLPCDLLAVLLLDEDCDDIGCIHIARYADNVITCKARIEWPRELMGALERAQSTFTSALGEPSFADIQALLSDWQSERVFQLVPIRTSKGVQGALLMAGSHPQAQCGHEIAAGLAERMAVAISNADRQNALVRQAHYDALTGLPNRVLFKDRLAQQIAHCQRSRSQFALLFIDLDRFKNINDSFGHTSGDVLLKSVAARFSEELSGVTTIARLGGDEFTIITSEAQTAADAANAAQAVIAALSRPVMLGDIEHFVSASIGIALYPQDGVTTEVLLRNADIAMYRAKSAGTGRFAYYEESMNREALERVELENELRHAIAREELSVVYQPRVDVRTGHLLGVEALSRWRHPRLGMVPPDRFIRIAEDSGLIIAIGDRVLRQVCEQYQLWREAGVYVQRLAYNVSVRQLQAPGFARSVREITKRHRVPSGVLEIEITESVLATDIDHLTSVLRDLHSMGIQIAIDDFGTGYSSLSYLQHLPIDTLKIDRSFLPRYGQAQAPAPLCEAILAMSKALQLTAVAEGVESSDQVSFLLRNGCHVAQGFYFSRPVSAEEISHRYGHGSSEDESSQSARG